MKLPTLRQTLMIGRIFFLKPFQSHPKVSGTELQTQQLSEHFDLKFSTFRPALVKNLWSTPHLKFSVMFSVYLFFQKNTQYTTHLTSLDSPILQKWIPFFSATQIRSTWNMEITSMTCFRGSTSLGKLPPGHVLLLNVSYLKNASFISVELVLLNLPTNFCKFSFPKRV